MLFNTQRSTPRDSRKSLRGVALAGHDGDRAILATDLAREALVGEVPVHVGLVPRVHSISDDTGAETFHVDSRSEREDVARADQFACGLAATDVGLIRGFARPAVGLRHFARVAADFESHRLPELRGFCRDSRRGVCDDRLRFSRRRFRDRFGGRDRSGGNRAGAALDVGFGAGAAGKRDEKGGEAEHSSFEHSSLGNGVKLPKKS